MNSPCMECTERHLACHSSCKRYAEFKKELSLMRKPETEISLLEYEQRRYHDAMKRCRR